MNERHNPELIINIIEIEIMILSDENILKRITELKNYDKLFIELVNILLGFYENLCNNVIGWKIRKTILDAIKFIKKLGIFFNDLSFCKRFSVIRY